MDRDVTEIKLQKYHETSDDIYPSLSICIKDPFLKEKYMKRIKQISIVQDLNLTFITEHPNIINSFGHLIDGNERDLKKSLLLLKNTYESLLLGLQEIDYDEVTIGIKELISNLEVTIPVTINNMEALEHLVYDVKNGTMVLNDEKSYQVNAFDEFNHVNTYVSARNSLYKCFTFDIPLRKRIQPRKLQISLNTSVFPADFSPSQFYFTLTYPNQLMHSTLGNRIRIPYTKAGCYKFEIHLGSTKVFKRRDKTKIPCNPDWRHQDEKELQYIAEKVGCNPKHWKLQSQLPNCSVPEQYLELKKQLSQNDAFMVPCRSIEKLAKRTKGTNLWRRCSFASEGSFLDLELYLDEEKFYEEVILSSAYTLQSLVGNAGKV